MNTPRGAGGALPPGEMACGVAPGPGAGGRECVNERPGVPLLPSDAETSLTLKVGLSSFWIVPVPWPFVMLAPLTFETLTKKFSLGSIAVSPLTVTSNEDD